MGSDSIDVKDIPCLTVDSYFKWTAVGSSDDEFMGLGNVLKG